jgi:competence ComEA-like helix-hairpin-helix protein
MGKEGKQSKKDSKKDSKKVGKKEGKKEKRKLKAQQLAVEAQEPDVVEEQPQPAGTRVNINTCTLDELVKLPRVGAVLAQRILEKRNEAAFRSPNDLLTVAGLGKATLKALQPLLDGFVAEQHAAPVVASVSAQSDTLFTLASWNVRNLSRNRSAESLAKIVALLLQFDLVAVQEVRDTAVLVSIDELLGAEWTHCVSDEVGTAAHKERYAFFWRKSKYASLR